MIVVQEITTWWTKRSRGPVEAAQRNRLPTVLPVPFPLERRPETLLHHRVDFHERLAFQEASEVVLRPFPRHRSESFACVGVVDAIEGVEIVFAYTSSCGAPARSPHPRTVMRLGPGEWGQVQYNGRTSSTTGHGDWLYRRFVLNVTVVARPTRDPFAGPPHRTFQSLRHLR